MYVIATHKISDSKKFFELASSMKNSVPSGLKSFFGLPSSDGTQMVCLWQGPSIDQVRGFLDKQTQGIAVNNYFQVDESKAIGLQELLGAQKAA